MKEKVFRSAVIFVCVLAVVVFAANDSFGADNGAGYVGINIAYSTLGGGDFDDYTWVTNEAVFITFPSFDAAGIAWGIVLGYRQNDLLSYEFSWLHSSHEASFFDPRDNRPPTRSDSIGRNQYILC